MKIPKFIKGKLYINSKNKQKHIIISSKELKKFGKTLPKNREVKVTW